MSTAAVASDPQIRDIEVTEIEITAHLTDGRTISVPLEWSWRLAEASPAQLDHYEVLGDGHYQLRRKAPSFMAGI